MNPKIFLSLDFLKIFFVRKEDYGALHLIFVIKIFTTNVMRSAALS